MSFVLFLKCGSYLGRNSPLCRVRHSLESYVKPVVSTKLSLLWVGTSASPQHSETLLFSSHSALFYAMPSRDVLDVCEVLKLTNSQGELLSRVLVLVFFSVSFPSQILTLNPVALPTIQKFSFFCFLIGLYFPEHSLVNLRKDSRENRNSLRTYCPSWGTKNC